MNRKKEKERVMNERQNKPALYLDIQRIIAGNRE